MGTRFWSVRTTLRNCLPLLLMSAYVAGFPPALRAQEATLESEVLQSEKLEIYQPNGRFSQEEVTWMLWYLIGVCVLGFLIFAVLRVIFREQSTSDLSRKSKGSPTRAPEVNQTSTESAQPPKEHRYKL